jgi:hypothetical protein
MRKLMLQRSILDILLDIWFIPMVTLYVKAMVKPLLYEMTPTEAKEMIENDLPHKGMSNALMTKGISNLFSEKAQ